MIQLTKIVCFYDLTHKFVDYLNIPDLISIILLEWEEMGLQNDIHIYIVTNTDKCREIVTDKSPTSTRDCVYTNTYTLINTWNI